MSLLVRSFLADAHPESRIRARALPAGVLPDDLAMKMDRFERRFVRKMGDSPAVVRVHARDFSLMYRSMGPAACFIATKPDGHILGASCMSCLRLRMPRGYVRRATVSANMSVLPEARHGATLARLVGASFRWTVPRAFASFSVIPEGSLSRPERFLPRLGLPGFSEFTGMTLVSFAAESADDAAAGEIEVVGEARVRAMHRTFTRGMIAAVGGTPSMRSKRDPMWIALRDGSACGCIEDYEAAKRHEYIEGPGELTMNHVSFLGYRDHASAGRLVRAALAITARQGVQRLQFAVDRSIEDALVAGVSVPCDFRFPMRVVGFALGAMPRAPWSLNSSEI